MYLNLNTSILQGRVTANFNINNSVQKKTIGACEKFRKKPPYKLRSSHFQFI